MFGKTLYGDGDREVVDALAWLMKSNWGASLPWARPRIMAGDPENKLSGRNHGSTEQCRKLDA